MTDIEPAIQEPSGLVHTNALGGLPYLADYLTLVERVYMTDFVPRAIRGNAGACLACVMHGAEIGLRPMQSFNSIDMIEGRPALKPEAMRALILEAGHSLDIRERNAERCEIAIHRREWPADKWETYSYDTNDARTAELLGKANWKKNPADMRFARCTARMARSVAPDVIRGLSYIPEELESLDVESTVVERPAAAAERPATKGQVFDIRNDLAELNNDQKAELRAWWKTEMPKRATVDAVPGDLIEIVRAKLTSLRSSDDGGDVIDAEVIEETSGDLPPDSSAAQGDHIGPARPSVPAGSSPLPAAAKDWYEVVETIVREMGIAPPERNRLATKFVNRPVRRVKDLTSIEAAAFVDYLESDEVAALVNAEGKLSDAFGDITTVSGV